jgi:hypothetical protein
MNERESDPTGAFRSGSAGLETDQTTGERQAPDGAQPGRSRSDDDRPTTDDQRGDNEAPGVDETERDVITSGTAATSEVADPAAQGHAEGKGDGTPQPR